MKTNVDTKRKLISFVAAMLAGIIAACIASFFIVEYRVEYALENNIDAILLGSIIPAVIIVGFLFLKCRKFAIFFIMSFAILGSNFTPLAQSHEKGDEHGTQLGWYIWCFAGGEGIYFIYDTAKNACIRMMYGPDGPPVPRDPPLPMPPRRPRSPRTSSYTTTMADHVGSCFGTITTNINDELVEPTYWTRFNLTNLSEIYTNALDYSDQNNVAYTSCRRTKLQSSFDLQTWTTEVVIYLWQNDDEVCIVFYSPSGEELETQMFPSGITPTLHFETIRQAMAIGTTQKFFRMSKYE